MIASCSEDILIAVIKRQRKSNLREKRFMGGHSWRLMTHRGGEGTATGVEVPDPIACTARKQRWLNTAAWLEFSLTWNSDPALGMVLPRLRI